MSVFLLTIIFPIFYTNECSNAIDPSEIRLNPGIFFPKANADTNTTNCSPTSLNSNQQQQSYSLNQPTTAGYTTNQSSTPNYNSSQPSASNYTTNQPISTSNMSTMAAPSYNNSYSSPNYSPQPNIPAQITIPQSNMYQPNQMYMNNAYGFQPQHLQPPNGNQPNFTCDNTGEREAFKKCVADSLKSLRNILENCRKTLGENAKECCINDECLISLTGKKTTKKEDRDFYSESESKSNQVERPHRSYDDHISHRSGHNDMPSRQHSNGFRRSYDDRDLYGPDYDRADSLEEFIQFLQKRLKDTNQEEWDRKPPSNAIFDALSQREQGGDSIHGRTHRKRGYGERYDCKDVCESPNMEQFDRFKKTEGDYGDLALSRYEDRYKNGRTKKIRPKRRKKSGQSEDGDGCKDVCQEHL